LVLGASGTSFITMVNQIWYLELNPEIKYKFVKEISQLYGEKL
jgi:hypothetical protein